MPAELTKSQNSEAKLTFFDLFAGIGNFRTGLEQTGRFRCIGLCEIDPHAERSYRAIHNINLNEIYINDAKQLDPSTLPDFDVLCAGFPCQSFSIAGKRRGFDDRRGTLFFDIARIVAAKHPAFLLLENVPGLLSHDAGRTFRTILRTLSELGYAAEWQVLNSQSFGVPQARKRVYIVGYLDPRCAGKIFPFSAHPQTAPVPAGEKGRLREATKNSAADAQNVPGLRIINNTKRGYDIARPGDSIDLCYLNQNSRRGRIGHGVCHTLTTKDDKAVVTADGRIRKLMPRECLRLQGLKDEQIDKLLAVTSPHQAYKQAGNAVTVNVVAAVGERLAAAAKSAGIAPCAPTGARASSGAPAEPANPAPGKEQAA